MVLLNIKGFALDPETGTPIAILKNEIEELVLPVWIGPAEASAIIVELENIHPPHPLTHDLFTYLFLRHGFKMDRLEIYDRSLEGSYLARIKYHRLFKNYCLGIRPSDGLALAVRWGAPIWVEEKLLLPPAGLYPFLSEERGCSEEVMFLNTEARSHSRLM
jgi:bifunctional DNase/RNase